MAGRKGKATAGFRSAFEYSVAVKLQYGGFDLYHRVDAIRNKRGLVAYYEPRNIRIPYNIPRFYIPDWYFPNEMTVVETKGLFDREDRVKLKLVNEAIRQGKQPGVSRLVVLFQKPDQKISPRTKTTYAEWCERHDIEYCTTDTLMEVLRNG